MALDQVKIAAEDRVSAKSRANNRLRKSGKIPAVVYGGEGGAEPIVIDDHEVEMILGGKLRTTALFTIDKGGKQTSAVVREIIRHPVTDRLIHVDFYRIDLTKSIVMQVPIHAQGTPVGVRKGGVMEFMMHHVELEGIPTAMPKFVDIKINDLEVNDSIHMSDLSLPDGVNLLTDPDETVLAIHPPKMTGAAAEDEEGEGEGEEGGEEAGGEEA